MRTSTRAVVPAVAALFALTGCGSDAAGSSGQGKLCGLVPQTLVEDQLEIQVEEVVGSESDTGADCFYQPAGSGDYQLLTLFSVARENMSQLGPQERIGYFFEDENFNRIDYQQVDGLGLAAGFGPMGSREGVQLCVVVSLPEGGRGEIRIFSGELLDRTPSLPQLRPIAERIIDGYAGSGVD